MSKQGKIQRGFTIFGVIVLLFNIFEYITVRLPRSEMATIIVECVLGIILIQLPVFVRRVLKIHLPQPTVYFYWFFLWLSVFMGTCLHLIRTIPGWDKVLHAVSPMLLTAVGYGICGLLLRKTKATAVSPWLFLLFGFAFAGLCGVFWEFWEFLCDSVANLNLQRYLDSPNNTGAPFVGRAALMDTMGDLFTNTAGALLMGLYALFSSRKKADYFDGYRITTLK